MGVVHSPLHEFVILSVAVLQAQRRISRLTGLTRKPSCTTAKAKDRLQPLTTSGSQWSFQHAAFGTTPSPAPPQTHPATMTATNSAASRAQLPPADRTQP